MRLCREEVFAMRRILAAACLIAIAIGISGCNASIHDVVSRREPVLVEAMLREDPSLVSARTSKGRTPMHYAVTYGAADTIELLAARGGDVNAADNTGLTPVHVAAMYNRRKEAERLLAHGGRLDATDAFGDTPLHLAAIHGQASMAEYLLEQGAAPGAKNHDGRTPLDLATKYRREEVIETLTQWKPAVQ